MNDKLYHDARLADFYDHDNGWADDTQTCLRLSEKAASVLDLGCGTGLLATAIAQRGTSVTGVDPAKAMLEIARRRDGGSLVRWVEGDSRTVRLERSFDLIVMTGHAFQCLLTDQDQLALFQTIVVHLNPMGRFIFDSRNPAKQEWREWDQTQSRRFFHHDKHGHVESWNDFVYDEGAGIVTYGTYYRLDTGEILAARSQIRFSTQQHLAALMGQAGLEVDEWMGDWRGGSYSADAKEIIPLGRCT